MRPGKLTFELPATMHLDLVIYAEVLARQTGHTISDPAKLIAPMLARFIITDRSFGKSRRSFQYPEGRG